MSLLIPGCNVIAVSLLVPVCYVIAVPLMIGITLGLPIYLIAKKRSHEAVYAIVGLLLGMWPGACIAQKSYHAYHYEVPSQSPIAVLYIFIGIFVACLGAMIGMLIGWRVGNR